jgi:hypothetical protein
VRNLTVDDLPDYAYRKAINTAILFRQELEAASKKLQEKRERLDAETEILLIANEKLDAANDKLKIEIKEKRRLNEILFQDLLNMGISSDRLSHAASVLGRCEIKGSG